MSSKLKSKTLTCDVVVLLVLLTSNTFRAFISYAFHPAFTCLKSTAKTPEQCVKSVQSY